MFYQIKGILYYHLWKISCNVNYLCIIVHKRSEFLIDHNGSLHVTLITITKMMKLCLKFFDKIEIVTHIIKMKIYENKN